MNNSALFVFSSVGQKVGVYCKTEGNPALAIKKLIRTVDYREGSFSTAQIAACFIAENMDSIQGDLYIAVLGNKQEEIENYKQFDYVYNISALDDNWDFGPDGWLLNVISPTYYADALNPLYKGTLLDSLEWIKKDEAKTIALGLRAKPRRPINAGNTRNIRDEFAIAALSMSHLFSPSMSTKDRTKWCYEIADSMLESREIVQ